MKLAASLILRIARPEGLIHVLTSAAMQDFGEPWELVIVDSACEERKEIVQALWDWLRTTSRVELIHVPPLAPLCQPRHCWDIPLFQNTGWVWARGEIVAHVEDHCTFNPSWLRRHVEFIRQHPNMVAIGDIFSAQDGEPHYGHMPTAEAFEKWLTLPDFKTRYENPTSRGCVNAEHYGYWLSGNMSCRLDEIIAFGGAGEIPTHYPESVVAPLFFEQGLSMCPLPGVAVKHHSHPAGGIIGYVMSRDADKNCVYEPVAMQHFNDIPPFDFRSPRYRRNLRAERVRLGRWIP